MVGLPNRTIDPVGPFYRDRQRVPPSRHQRTNRQSVAGQGGGTRRARRVGAAVFACDRSSAISAIHFPPSAVATIHSNRVIENERERVDGGTRRQARATTRRATPAWAATSIRPVRRTERRLANRCGQSDWWASLVAGPLPTIFLRAADRGWQRPSAASQYGNSTTGPSDGGWRGGARAARVRSTISNAPIQQQVAARAS